jgi:Spy/CpxP family protein refolding chaperone
MNTQSIRKRTLFAGTLVAAIAMAVALLGTTVASAQPARDRGPWERLDLTQEQREKVREIVKEHRDASRAELHAKLKGVLTEEQLEQFDKMERGRRGSMWDNRPGRRGQGRGDMSNRGRGWDRGRDRGRCGECDCNRGGHGHGRKGMRRGGAERGDFGRPGGPGPHMGEFREERGARMVERLGVVLDLTDAQKDKVASIVKEHQAQFKDFDRSQLSFEERQQTRDAHRALLANRIKGVLNDEQQAKYDEWMKTMPGPRHGGKGKRK